MKKISTILMALMVLCLTQCKPAPEGGGDDNGNVSGKVKVRCEMAINNGTRSDFTNLIDEGRINWSHGRECVYVAIHGANPQIIELESWAEGNPPVLEFTGEAAEGLIEEGEEYDVWYFGHSQQLGAPYVNMVGNSKVEGSIANQSGRLDDLGYCHIAMTKVKAEMEDGVVKLNLVAVLKTQIAIALLDLEKVTELYGDAIVGTEYSLEYNEGADRYELNVVEDADARISVESASGISYVVLLPNDNKESVIKSVQDSKVYGYTFRNYIKAPKVYRRVASDGKTVEALPWTLLDEKYAELPKVKTSAVSEITIKSAVCGGEVTSDGNGTITARGICWSTSQNPTIEDSKTTNGSGLGSYTSKMTGLEHGTTYYVRAYATNEVGTAYGEEVSFTTIEKLLPTVTTATKVTDITVSSAVCGGEVTFDGNVAVTARGICWSTSQNPTIEDSKTTNGSGLGSYTSKMTGLEHGTTYYVRAYATNEVGTAYGEEVSFTTIEKLLPTVTTTSEVTDITVNSAKCGGEVTFDGNVSVTARGICWSTRQNPTIEDNKTTNGNGVGTFTSNMTNLEPNTTYYVRAYAANEVGTSYGEEVSFTTNTSLVVTTSEVTSVTVASAVCGGVLTVSGNVSVTVVTKGICWSTSSNPTIEDNKTTDGSGLGSYTSSMTALEHDTRYYVRAYATISDGNTLYGETRIFKTIQAYSPATGAINGHTYVDLGLPSGLKWASCNMGASSPEEYGVYYAWGETTTKSSYTSNNSKTYGKAMNDISGNLQYDAAVANWGGNWRMPTKVEMQELIDKCTWIWTNTPEFKGYIVTGPNGNSIFLPAAGRRDGSSLDGNGGSAFYWSSTPYDDYYRAYYLYFNSDDHYMYSIYRNFGTSVRPVIE